ncbi:hypothetical protein [Clostridium faecium]|uniref:hypothetical protein n=1 Tax=Clostridium faecium TaxID=2762223 RepID=UPI0028BDC22D|nr:hypothetical protein [Clostridium faecium]
MQVNWWVGSLIASVAVIIRSKYGVPLTTIRKTSAEERPAVNIRISSYSSTPKAFCNDFLTIISFVCGIIVFPPLIYINY